MIAWRAWWRNLADIAVVADRKTLAAGAVPIAAAAVAAAVEYTPLIEGPETVAFVALQCFPTVRIVVPAAVAKKSAQFVEPALLPAVSSFACRSPKCPLVSPVAEDDTQEHLIVAGEPSYAYLVPRSLVGTAARVSAADDKLADFVVLRPSEVSTDSCLRPMSPFWWVTVVEVVGGTRGRRSVLASSTCHCPIACRRSVKDFAGYRRRCKTADNHVVDLGCTVRVVDFDFEGEHDMILAPEVADPTVGAARCTDCKQIYTQ